MAGRMHVIVNRLSTAWEVVNEDTYDDEEVKEKIKTGALKVDGNKISGPTSLYPTASDVAVTLATGESLEYDLIITGHPYVDLGFFCAKDANSLLNHNEEIYKNPDCSCFCLGERGVFQRGEYLRDARKEASVALPHRQKGDYRASLIVTSEGLAGLKFDGGVHGKDDVYDYAIQNVGNTGFPVRVVVGTRREVEDVLLVGLRHLMVWWRPSIHWRCSPATQQLTHTIMLASVRLAEVSETGTRTRNGVKPLPPLPEELWMLILRWLPSLPTEPNRV